MDDSLEVPPLGISLPPGLLEAGVEAEGFGWFMDGGVDVSVDVRSMPVLLDPGRGVLAVPTLK